MNRTSLVLSRLAGVSRLLRVSAFHTKCSAEHYEDGRGRLSSFHNPDLLRSDEIVPPTSRRKRIIVGLTGATGSLIGVRLLQAFKALDVETHTILSKWGASTLKYETDYTPEDVKNISSYMYGMKDMSAAISSGSFPVDGMVVAPCSMKTLAATKVGFCDDLIVRAADVSLKERRKLVLVVRETPFSSIHLENMLSLSRNGATIFPPVPAFYHKPNGIEDIVAQTVGRIIDQFGLDSGDFCRWRGGLNKER